MCKKVIKVLLCAITDILLIAVFSMCALRYTDDVGRYGSVNEIEYALFAVMALIFYRLYVKVNRFGESKSLRIVSSVGTALCYTAALWLLNSYWIYAVLCGRLPSVLIYYKYVLLSNILYSRSWGKMRYPLTFFLMLMICLLLPRAYKKLKAVCSCVNFLK